MSMTPTSTAIRQVIHEFRPKHHLAVPPGSFTGALIKAMVLADPKNLSKLSEVFPDHAEAVILLQRNPGGWAVAEDAVRREEEGEWP